MKHIALLSILAVLSCTGEQRKKDQDAYLPDQRFKVVGYLMGSNFDKIDLLELDLLTHLNLAFANPDRQGNLVFGGGIDLRPVVSKGHDHGLKVFVSLAGGGRPDTTIWKSVLEPDNRSDIYHQHSIFCGNK